MPDPQGSAHLRLTIVGVVVLALFVTLLSRATYLQAMDSGSFLRQARENRVRVVYTPAPRGRILDRHNSVIVDNRVSNVITLSRESAAKNPRVIDRLAALLRMDRATIEARVKDARFSPFTPVPIVAEAPEEAIVFIREHQDEFQGVDASRAAERAYPHGTLAAHLLGYVGKINAEELKERRRDNYQPSDEIGKSGVELLYEEWLRGKPGVTRLEVDSQNRVVRSLFHADPVPGHDIRLTLDLNVQLATEAALASATAAARGTFDDDTQKRFVAPAGAAVVLDPQDGSVRAIASMPTFNPADFVGGISTPQFQALTAPEAYFPLNDRAIGGEYSPGSTFKLATAVAALNTRLIDPRTNITDTGRYQVRPCAGERCVFRNAGEQPNGLVNMQKSLTVSSDVYYYALGDRFWRERANYGENAIQDTAEALGLGAKTGIGLLGERPGRVPTPQRRAEQNRQNPRLFPNGEWRTGDNINLSIGQGDLVLTPLQMAKAYATFATGGRAYVPRVASDAVKMTRSGPKVVEVFAPRRADGPTIGDDVKAPIEAGLRGVVTDPKGTAYAAFAGSPVSSFVAGKTGTAQVRGKQDTALFAAYAPIGRPEWSVAVILEEAGFGGAVAAPVARRILEAAFGQADVGAVDIAGSARE